MSVYEQSGHKQGTDQVAEINKQVVFHKCLKGDLMVEQGNDHKAVTGEQLTAVADNHRKSCRENGGRKHVIRAADGLVMSAEATDAAAPASAINMPAKKPSSSMCRPGRLALRTPAIS